MGIRKILLLTDFSEESVRAYAPAAELAQALGAGLTLLHVVYDPAVPHGTAYGKPHAAADVGRLVSNARASLENHLAMLPAAAHANAELIASQSAPEAVVEYARAQGYDLTVLSSHGRAGFRRLVMGSAAEAIARKSHTPVLLVPRQA